ncbi:MAG: VRR-NUC domain-containing protein [Acidobacteriota bacterium]|nr:VRR-NUC domain-containing protein [Acidobacteriota bacterium]
MDELPVGYYLDNFLKILDFVDNHYADILALEERELSRRFRSVSLSAQRLYVRLIGRKGPHFRVDKLHYPEIPDLHHAADELARAELLCIDAPVSGRDLQNLVALPALPELVQLVKQRPDRFADTGPLSRYNKSALVQLVTDTLTPAEIHSAVRELFSWFTPRYVRALQVYKLLFFGNLRQDLTEFVLEDLGMLRYEDYSIEADDRLFNSRELVKKTIVMSQLNEWAWLAEEGKHATALWAFCLSLPDPGEEPSLRRRYDRTLNRAGRFFERIEMPDIALKLYDRTLAPPSRERRARILEREGRYKEALYYCETIAKAPRDEEEREFSARFAVKLHKKLGYSTRPVPRLKPPQIDLTVPLDPQLHVEERVLQHYAEQKTPCFYAENVFWQSLFGLLFWDIIFMSVRGAFFNHYQRGPKGLFSSRFRDERTAAVLARLEEIAQGGATERAIHTFEAKNGIACYLVHWRYLTREMLDLALSHIPAAHLRAIMDRLSRDPGEYRTGFPDLLVFFEEGYRLVEVKGPGDQLQNNQRRWMRYFEDHKIPYAVAKVSWTN